MLTKTDLKQIRGVVHEEVDVVVENKLKPIKTDINQIGNVVDEKLDYKLKPIKKNLRYLKKTVDLIVKNYDEGDVKIERRVRKIDF